MQNNYQINSKITLIAATKENFGKGDVCRTIPGRRLKRIDPSEGSSWVLLV
jgi:hypothetical protein